MERLLFYQYRSEPLCVREIFYINFEEVLFELHGHGFVHSGIRKDRLEYDGTYIDVKFTKDGLRLTGLRKAILRHQVGNKIFQKLLQEEQANLKIFKDHFIFA